MSKSSMNSKKNQHKIIHNETHFNQKAKKRVSKSSKQQQNKMRNMQRFFNKIIIHFSSGKGQFSFQFQRQCQRMFKPPYNCTHFMCLQGYAQNPSSQASAAHEPRNSRCTSWLWKRQKNQRSNCQHLLDPEKAREFQEKTSTTAFLIMPKRLTVWITKNWKIL